MERKYKVVVSESRFPDYDQEREVLGAVGAELMESGVPYGVRDDVALGEAAKDADALMVCLAHIGSEVIDRLEKCRIIVRYGMGYDNVDVAYATKKGIMVANVTDHCVNEVADTALAHILCQARKLALSARDVRGGGWGVARLKPIRRLSETCLGVWGVGRIGRNVAKKAAALGFQVIGYDPYLPPGAAADAGVPLVSYEEFLSRADIITLHLQLTDQTRGMVDREVFSRMKRGAQLVNVSRGPIINEADLAEAIRSGQLGGAGLDVVCHEPMKLDDPLLSFDNVVISAHTAWYSEQSNRELQRKAAQIVADALEGRPVATLLNREVLG